MNSFTVPGLNGVRDILCLKSGQTMIVASANSDQLIFFKRTRQCTKRVDQSLGRARHGR